ncbi:NAD(P)H-hydrate epimerase [Clostridium baratii]
MEILSVEGCRNIDNFTIKNIGIPSIVLMENAASKISDEVNNMGDTVTIFCGIGNNGGDGLAVARKLYLAGKNVEIVLLGNEAKASEEVKVNLNIVRNLNINITKHSR